MRYPFTNFRVYPKVSGGSVLVWDIDPAFTVAQPWGFVIEYSRSGGVTAEEWLAVTATTLTGTSISPTGNYTDAVQRIFSSSERLFYRIRLVYGVTSVSSDTVNAWGDLNTRDRALYKQIATRELLLLRKRSGSFGNLFRLRRWGPRCDNPGCLDFDTLVPTNPSCPVCFGTGRRSGYFTPEPLLLSFSQTASEGAEIAATGTAETDISNTARCLSQTQIRSGDIWCDDTGTAYVVRKVATVAAVRSVPLIFVVEMRNLPPSDVFYRLVTAPDSTQETAQRVVTSL